MMLVCICNGIYRTVLHGLNAEMEFSFLTVCGSGSLNLGQVKNDSQRHKKAQKAVRVGKGKQF
jgi:hypothetical protein